MGGTVILWEHKTYLEAVTPEYIKDYLKSWLGHKVAVSHAWEFVECATRDYKEDKDRFVRRLLYCKAYKAVFACEPFQIHLRCTVQGHLIVALFGPSEALQKGKQQCS